MTSDERRATSHDIRHSTFDILKKSCNLYLVTSEEWSAGRSTLEVAKEAVAAGVGILQMREKSKSSYELRSLGKELASICRAGVTLFIVNDDPELAREVGADGVHLGQEDLGRVSIDEARSILGKDKIIGISTHSLDQFREANSSDCDYIAFGPVFPTGTKDYHIGTDDVGTVLGEAGKPVVFIGGINLDNAGELAAKGAKNIAVIRAVTEADDIGEAVRELKGKLS